MFLLFIMVLTFNSIFFLNISEQVVKLCQKIPNLKYELIGSWSVRVGDLDQYIHLWKHQGGYAAIDKTNNVLLQNQVSFLFQLIYIITCLFCQY